MRIFSVGIFLLAASAHAEPNVDLQWSVCVPDAAVVAVKLGIAKDPKEGSVSYFDSIPVSYIDEGITFRLKTGKGDGVESSVKVRHPEAGEIAGADCEWDRYGDKRTYTCEALGADASPKDPWTNDQRKLAERQSRIDWEGLRSFGPYPDLKWKTEILGYKLSLDSVKIPKDLPSLTEISVKVPLSQGDEVYRQVDSALRRLGIALCPAQESKTLRLFKALGLKK